MSKIYYCTFYTINYVSSFYYRAIAGLRENNESYNLSMKVAYKRA